MLKIFKAFKAFVEIVKMPYLLNLIIENEETHKRIFHKKFPEIKQFKQISLTDFLEEDKSVQVSPFAYLSGASLPTDLALLQLVSKKHKVENYLEIGTWRGESVANVAPFVKNCFSLNLSDETMREMGMEENYIKMHRFFSKNICNVTHLFGHSQTFNYDTLNVKFDLVFIDGDHHTESVAKDTQKILSVLKNDASIIVWHDAQIDPENPRFEVLLGVYQGVPKEKHKHIYLVSNSLCAIYYPFDVAATDFMENKTPQQFYSVSISNQIIEH